MPRHHSNFDHRVHAWLAWVCVAALLLVATAAFWHHHEHAGSNDCAVCVAVVMDKSDGLPPAAVAPAPAPLAGVVAVPRWRDASVDVRGRCLARGPPDA